MCQAPIGKVTSIGSKMITVEYRGKQIDLRSKLADISVGDYVMFSVDVAVDKVSEDEATMALGGLE